MQSPIDKAVRDHSKAAQNLSILVLQWFCLCRGVVDVTSGSPDSFAQDLKGVTKRLNINGTPDRLERRLRALAVPSPLTPEAPTEHASSQPSQLAPRGRSDQSSHRQRSSGTIDNCRFSGTEQREPDLLLDTVQDPNQPGITTDAQEVLEVLLSNSFEAFHTPTVEASDSSANNKVPRVSPSILMPIARQA